MKTQILYPWKWIDLVWVQHPNNPWKLWEGAFRKGNGRVVSALVENISRKTFVFVEQFRPLLDAKTIELVAGLVDPWYSDEEAIAKEIREETGYTAQKIDFLLTGPKSAGLTNEMTTEYYAQVSWNPEAQMLEASEVWLLVRECENTLYDVKKFLASEEKLWKLITPWIWSAIGKALVDEKIALS